MNTAHEIYKHLSKAEKTTHHLVLAGLFELVFGRKLRKNEWGFLRKLIRIYGSEVMYWAIVASAQATGPTPLAYVMGVCKGMLKETVTTDAATIMAARTYEILNMLRRLKEELVNDGGIG